DYLPRSILGEYLKWVNDYLIQELPTGIRVHYYNNTVTDIIQLDNGNLRIILDGDHSFAVGGAVLTPGHGQNRLDKLEKKYLHFVKDNRSRNLHLGYLRCYPLTQLQTVQKEARVAIQGLGLSCHDILSELTYERGGRFVQCDDGQELTYVKSGQEPAKIYIYSRNCLPFSARGKNEKGVGGQYQARFFTRSMIDQLREKSGPQLDFDKDLLPILVYEMCFVYDCTLNNTWDIPHDKYEPDEKTRQIIHHLFYPLENIEFADFESYVLWVIHFLENDIDEAYKGNVTSAVKAATDVLRDLRDTIRYVVDFRGLTLESHRRFLKEICPIMNRMAVGPPKERNEQLLALLRSGLVEFASASHPKVRTDATSATFVISSMEREVHADVLVKGMIEQFIPHRDESPLIQNMLKRGLIRPFLNGDFHPGGIDVNRQQNLISANGTCIRNLWALGNICEGPNWYTYVLPRPLVNSRSLQDAGKCALNIFEYLTNRNKNL
ncbi:unnamed protein product, partial [Didymodactylos carnosus]